MSNFLAIATVTATLSQVLRDGIQSDVAGADVTTLDPSASGSAVPATRLNLFLYQVTPNAAFRNADLPTRRSDGQLVLRPQVALDLHYLLTFYGDEGQLEPQRLLGSAVRTLHERPLLTRQKIQQTIMQSPFDTFLGNSNLADGVELVKFTPTPLSLEELSKLWSVFFQIPYRLSVAYQGTVVLIESEETSQAALPVRDLNIYVMPFRQPLIEQVTSQAGVSRPIIAGSTLLIIGQRLRGDVTRVRIGGEEVTPPEVSDTQISLPLSSPLLPAAALRAGVQGVQVVHKMLMGTPETEHRGVESNVAAFVLSPTITQTISNIGSVIENGTTLFSATVTVTFTPSVGRTQRLKLLLNEFNAPDDRPPRDYSFPAPKDNGITDPNQTETSLVAFSIGRVLAGEYLVRGHVDGADSVLRMNLAVSPPVFEPGQTVIIQ